MTLDEPYVGQHLGATTGAFVQLSINDTGCGLDQETRSHVFEPFFTTKEKGKGTGLGLSTVYGIVKQASGYIMAYSELACGTTFKIYFPLVCPRLFLGLPARKRMQKSCVLPRLEAPTHLQ